MNRNLEQALDRGFTLIQVIITLAVFLVISTIAVLGYSEVINRSQQSICRTNLEILTTAVELYSMENEALPATLGELEKGHFERAYAKVMEENYWEVRLAGAVTNLSMTSTAHAGFLTYENLMQIATKENFNDPADGNGAPSYGINASLMGRKWGEIGSDEIVIADSDQYVFSAAADMSARHRTGLGGERVALAMNKSKEAVEVGSGQEAVTPTAGEVTSAQENGTDETFRPTLYTALYGEPPLPPEELLPIILALSPLSQEELQSVISRSPPLPPDVMQEIYDAQ